MKTTDKILIAILTAFAQATAAPRTGNGSTAQAQSIMRIHVKNATPVDIETAKIDSLLWEDATTLRLFLNDATTADYAVANVDSLTWQTAYSPDDTVVKGDIELSGAESFVVNEQLTEVHASACTVIFSPTVADEDTQLVVRTATKAPPVTVPDGTDGQVAISENAVTVDLDLSGIHHLTGVAEIRIPMAVADGDAPGAAYYNETTDTWEPVDHSYDAETGEVVIVTGHLSTFTAFTIKNEHTRAAKISFYAIPDTDTDLVSFSKDLGRVVDGALSLTDFAADWYGELSNWGLTISYNAVGACGLQEAFCERWGETLGNVGIALMIYQTLRSEYQDDHAKAAGTAMKTIVTHAMNYAPELVKTASMKAAMSAVAILDYSLGKFAELAWQLRTDIYDASYQWYYISRGTGDGLKHHYMSARDWYDKLLPVFTKDGQTAETVHADVEKIVDDYVNEFWQDETEIALYFEHFSKMGYSAGGGLNNSMKAKLSSEHKTLLMETILPNVFRSIGRKLRNDGYLIATKEMTRYAEMANQVVTISLRDANANGGLSDLNGYRVRFKNLPKTITDPDKWECKLSNAGQGNIKFRLFPYLNENMRARLELLSPDGKVAKELAFTMVVPRTVIKVDLGNSQGTPVDLEGDNFYFSKDGETRSYKLNSKWTSVSASTDVNWASAYYDDGQLVVEVLKHEPLGRGDLNYTSRERSATVTVTGQASGKPASFTFNITQEAEWDIRVAAGAPAEAGYATMFIEMNADVAGDVAVSYDIPWLSNPEVRGERHNLDFQATQNPSNTWITFKNEANYTLEPRYGDFTLYYGNDKTYTGQFYQKPSNTNLSGKRASVTVNLYRQGGGVGYWQWSIGDSDPLTQTASGNTRHLTVSGSTTDNSYDNLLVNATFTISATLNAETMTISGSVTAHRTGGIELFEYDEEGHVTDKVVDYLTSTATAVFSNVAVEHHNWINMATGLPEDFYEFHVGTKDISLSNRPSMADNDTKTNVKPTDANMHVVFKSVNSK